MSSIYIHIPYCKKACYYCDFHFSAFFGNKPEMLLALNHELVLEAGNFIKPLQSIYFGGGTPSVLTCKQLAELLNTINTYYKLDNKPEITIEVNPDDLSPNYLRSLKEMGITRLSIGIQSFNDKILTFLNRRHNAANAKKSIDYALNAGFNNLNLDLIYGIPGLTNTDIELFIKYVIGKGIPHISAYHLGIEPRTLLYRFLQQGKIKVVSEQESVEQYNLVTSLLGMAGFEHYEISNFCQKGYYSKHNLGYWQQKAYLGIGPSAHSLINNLRRWNVRNNKSYIEHMQSNTPNKRYEKETIDPQTALNDYLLTSLRTIWGINITEMEETFPVKHVLNIEKQCIDLAKSELMDINSKGNYYLTRQGMFIADNIIRKLLVV